MDFTKALSDDSIYEILDRDASDAPAAPTATGEGSASDVETAIRYKSSREPERRFRIAKERRIATDLHKTG